MSANFRTTILVHVSLWESVLGMRRAEALRENRDITDSEWVCRAVEEKLRLNPYGIADLGDFQAEVTERQPVLVRPRDLWERARTARRQAEYEVSRRVKLSEWVMSALEEKCQRDRIRDRVRVSGCVSHEVLVVTGE